MKFEYMDQEKGDDTCVAFECRGNLYIKCEDGGNIVMEKSGNVYKGTLPFFQLTFDNKKKFYPGDKITITF